MRKTITVTIEAHRLLTDLQTEHGYKSLTDTIVSELAKPTERNIAKIYKHLAELCTILHDIEAPKPSQAEQMLSYIKDNNLEALEDFYNDFFTTYGADEADVLNLHHLNSVLSSGTYDLPNYNKKATLQPHDGTKIQLNDEDKLFLRGYHTKVAELSTL